MSKTREIVKLKLTTHQVRKYFELFPDSVLGGTVDTLLEYFLEEANREDGTHEEVLQRMYERLQT
jgi:ferritin-like protein